MTSGKLNIAFPVRYYTTISSNINNPGKGNKVLKYLVKKGLGLGSTQGKILSR